MYNIQSSEIRLQHKEKHLPASRRNCTLGIRPIVKRPLDKCFPQQIVFLCICKILEKELEIWCMGQFFSLQRGDYGIHSLWKGADTEWVLGWMWVLLSCREGAFQNAVATANRRIGLRFSLKYHSDGLSQKHWIQTVKIIAKQNTFLVFSKFCFDLGSQVINNIGVFICKMGIIKSCLTAEVARSSINQSTLR